jgi:hypothetical protein
VGGQKSGRWDYNTFVSRYLFHKGYPPEASDRASRKGGERSVKLFNRNTVEPSLLFSGNYRSTDLCALGEALPGGIRRKHKHAKQAVKKVDGNR